MTDKRRLLKEKRIAMPPMDLSQKCKYFVNLTEKRFGKLAVLYAVDASPSGLIWLCRCDCGKLHPALSNNLKRENGTKSCGCESGTKAKEHTNKLKMINFRGVGELTGSFWSSIVARMRKLNKLGKMSDLTIEEAWQQFQKQNGRCAWTGLPLILPKTAKDMVIKGRKTASPERINSDLGYTKNNFEWVHNIINEMKMDRSSAEFYMFCKLVTYGPREGFDKRPMTALES